MPPDKVLTVAPPGVCLRLGAASQGRVRTQHFHRATAAYGAAGALRPDAVIVSLALPGGRGPRLCQRLRALLGESTPIIACGPIPPAVMRELPPRAALRRTWGADRLLPNPTPSALDAVLLSVLPGPDEDEAPAGVLEQVWRWARRAAS